MAFLHRAHAGFVLGGRRLRSTRGGTPRWTGAEKIGYSLFFVLLDSFTASLEQGIMETTSRFQSLVRLAIEEERKAQQLYKRMGAKTRDPFVRAILEGLHEQEVQHEKKLRSLLASVEPQDP